MISPSTQSSLNIASKDKFLLVLTLPYILRKLGKTNTLFDVDKIQMSVFGSVVPTISVPPTELRYGGQSTNVSSHSRPNYTPLNVKFVVDNHYNNYYLLWNWLSILNDPETSLYNGIPQKQLTNVELAELGSNAQYQTTLSILGLNEYGQSAIEFVYTNAFITNLGGIDFSDRDGSIIECSAEFQFNQLYINKYSIAGE